MNWNLTNSLVRVVREAISGMALGVDTLFALSVLELKKEGYDIKLHCAVPCFNQDRLWPKYSQEQYHDILDKADIVKIVTESEYDQFVMNIQNYYMVDNSDKVLAVWDGTPGGTRNCVEYAKEKGKEIYRIYPKIFPLQVEKLEY